MAFTPSVKDKELLRAKSRILPSLDVLEEALKKQMEPPRVEEIELLLEEHLALFRPEEPLICEDGEMAESAWDIVEAILIGGGTRDSPEYAVGLCEGLLGAMWREIEDNSRLCTVKAALFLACVLEKYPKEGDPLVHKPSTSVMSWRCCTGAWRCGLAQGASMRQCASGA